MIADLDESLCTDCGQCVEVCPVDVFARTPDGVTIARVEACQTCFLCELYCPADALYVDPDAEQVVAVNRAAIAPLRGKFRRESGWGAEPEANPNLHWRMDEIFRRARAS